MEMAQSVIWMPVSRLQPYLTDPDARVRRAAMAVLTETAPPGTGVALAEAAGDGSGTVRHAAADGLAALAAGRAPGSPGEACGPEGRRALERLAGDADPLVRAAAFKAAGAMGCPPPLDALAVAALAAGTAGDAAWQARAGAAQALAAVRPDVAVPPLADAVCDPHPDVRKAAVVALAPMRGRQAAADALRAAAADSDADVRAYARRAPGPLPQIT